MVTRAVARYSLTYGVGLLLVVSMAFVTPALEERTGIVLFVAAVVGLATLPWVLVVENRKALLLGALAFIVPFSGVDKWFLFRWHNGGSPGIQLSIADMLMAVLYALWLWEYFVSERRALSRRGPANVPLLAAVGFVILSSASLINATNATLVLFELLQTVKLILWFVYLSNNVNKLEHLRAMGVGLIGAVMVHSSFAIVEKMVGHSVGLGILGEQSGVTVGLFAGTYTRVGGLLGHPVMLGAFFALTLPFLLAVIVSSAGALARTAGAVGVLVGGLVLALTLSRGAAIAWVFALCFFVVVATMRGWLSGNARHVIVALVCVVVIAALVASPVVYERLVVSDPGSVSGRVQLNETALRVIGAHPVVGAGLNNWPLVMAAYDTTGISRLTTDPVHNLYLLLWAETGLLGLAGFVALAVVLLLTGYRALREASDPTVQVAALGAVTALLAILIMGAASWELRLTPEHQLFWSVAALIVALQRMACAPAVARTVNSHA